MWTSEVVHPKHLSTKKRTVHKILQGHILLIYLCIFSKTGRAVGRRTRVEEFMHLAMVACGSRLEETLTLVKSAVLFSQKKIKVHIFAEDLLIPQFQEKV